MSDPAQPAPRLTALAIDTRLAAGKSDGWRYDVLPPDGQAARLGLAGLDQTAQALFQSEFAALDAARQEEVLRAVQLGDPPGDIWQTLPAARFFEDLLAEAAEVFYSHPLAQEEIGYVGMADGLGWKKIGLNEREAWEPLPIGGGVEPGTGSAGLLGESRSATEELPLMGLSSVPEALSPGRPVFQHRVNADTVDAVVIGTGAGGAPLLARLAQAGLKVVALEAGRFWNPQDFATDERAQTKLFWNDERLSAGGSPLAFGANNSGIGVGGSTLHYTAYTPRAHADDFQLHTEFGVGKDWPLGLADLTPYYDELERFLGVSGPSPYPWDADLHRQPYPLAPLPLERRGPIDAAGVRLLWASGHRQRPMPRCPGRTFSPASAGARLVPIAVSARPGAASARRPAWM